MEADVATMDGVRSMVDATVDRYGRLDIVHSNAYSNVMGTATEITEADWDRTLDLCLKATWMIAHCGFPVMLEHGGGAMVITASVHSIRGYLRHAAYDAAKGGLLGLMRGLAADYAPDIRVNAILPGAVPARAGENRPERYPLRRVGTPHDIAQAALFLASDMSSYMTGTYLVVDGGLTSIIESG